MENRKILPLLASLTFSIFVFAAIAHYRTGGGHLLILFGSGLAGAVFASAAAAAFALLKKLILPGHSFRRSFVRFLVVATLLIGFANYSAAKYERSQEFKNDM